MVAYKFEMWYFETEPLFKDRQSTASSNTRIKEFGPWSEQYSSSGKRYFYNRETEVSQWEKPAEWREYERSLNERATSHSPKSSSCKVLILSVLDWKVPKT